MIKFLNVFNTLADYQAFSASTEYTQPNVALVKESNVLYYDYGNNQPKVDMSNYKVESQETSVGGDKYGNSAITKINYIPNGITSLIDAFKFFYSLEEVTCKIPDSVIHMKSTFYYCSSLVNAPDIPISVTDMTQAFFNCSSLKELTLLPTTPPNYNSILSGCSSLETIYVPDESVDAYKTATGWSQFADKFKPLSSKPTE